MRQRSKRYKKIKNILAQKKNFKLIDAIKILKETSTAHFIESIEFHSNLNINPKHSINKKKKYILLPYRTNRILKIAVLTKENNFNLALSAKADIVGNQDLIEKIIKKEIFFDILIATPEMIPELTKIGKILTLNRKMPSLKKGTITEDLENTINRFKEGKVTYKADKTGIIHAKIGSCNFKTLELIENFKTFYFSIKKDYSNLTKGNIFKTIYLCTTLSPAIKLDLSEFN
uniref:Ribosomal protein L1 n=1 Tax=Nitzschia sp. PL1-4 TaxID=2083272 RepID=A0A2Z5ZB08_9STRA|nr:ribosomal protein L1 [Nitzschia sp. PL1-4]